MTTAPLAPPASIPHRSTPSLLKRGRTAILLITAGLFAISVWATGVHRCAMHTVGVDSAPSIISAQHIKSALADMDAAAADELLSPPGGVAPLEQKFNARRTEATDSLVTAAQHINFAAERDPILTMDLHLETYEGLIQHALDLRATDSSAAIDAYDRAAAELDQVLLPAAGRLDEANNVELEHAYMAESSHSAWARATVFAGAAVTLFALVWMQIFLSRRTRRTFNPLLLAATLLTAGWAVFDVGGMLIEQQQLRIAKEDAFDSIHALWRARAVSYEANANQSRYLLDEKLSPVRADHDKSDMNFEAGMIANTPPGITLEQLVDTLNQGGKVPGFNGYLQDELNNITFEGERDQALNSIAFWERYETIDHRVQDLDAHGQHQQAIDLYLGSQQGQTQGAYDNFDRVLQATLDINQKAFENAVRRGLDAVKPLDLVSAACAVLVALLTFLGIGQRIREYE
jgi:hypothetical protein